MGFHSESTSRTSPLRRAFAALATRRRVRPAAVRRAAMDVIEALEGRRLLAVVAAGDTAYYYNGTSSFKIVVTGSGSFTFTAAVHPATGGGISLEEVPLSIVAGPDVGTQYGGGYHVTLPAGAPAGATLPLFDIYSILSSDTSSDTSLSITQFTPATASARAFSTPFSTGAGMIHTDLGNPGDTLPVSLNLGDGGVFIGGRANSDAVGTDPVLSLTKNTSIASSTDVSLPSGQTYQPGIFITGLNGHLASVGQIFIAGTITGRVLITGSVNTFYAGNILTGDTTEGDTSGIGVQNFRVGGDLRNLIVSGGIGTVTGAPDAFVPGTEISVGGRVQQIKTGLEFRGSVDVNGATGKYTDGSDLTEIETRAANNTSAAGIGNAFDNFQLLNQGVANNDTFATPQVLGSYKSDTTKTTGQITLTGAINNGSRVLDDADYYGVPLLAGQTITVQLAALNAAYLAVYDPDGRQVATDQSNQNDIDFSNQAIQITATTAGLYRVAALPVQPTIRVAIDRPYTLTITKLGDVGIGGLVSSGDIFLSAPTLGFRVHNADLGAILAGGMLYGADATDSTGAPVARDAVLDNPIITNSGNIRAITAAGISYKDPNTGDFGLFPNIVASKSVGRIQSSSYCYFNDTGLNTSTAEPSANLAIGGDYQVIQATGDFSANLSADGGIGVIRAGSVATGIEGFPGFFQINADAKNNDGFIGLIDCVGNFGTFEYGGPAISAGQGSSSNVKYMHVGGNVYRDVATGAGQSVTVEPIDTAATIIDDSGASVTITPIVGDDFDNTVDTTTGSNGTDTNTGSGTDDTVIGSDGSNPIGTNPNEPDPIGTIDTTTGSDGGDGTTGGTGTGTTVDTRPRTASGRLIGGQLSIGTYPTRNGGSVIFRVTASDYLTTDPRSIGVEITTTGSATNASGDIGELITTNNNQANVLDPNADQPNERPNSKSTLVQADTGTNEEVLMSGITTNVFDIHGVTGPADYTNIFNGTDGEIVNITADSVGSIEGNYVGVSHLEHGVQLDGLNNANATTANIYPFNNAKNLIDVGNVMSIRSRGPLGNISATNIGLLEANSDDRNVKGTMEGIIAPVVASNSIFRTDIGEGLATSGSGNVSTGGLYASNTLGLISNDNGNGDLRGDVIAGNYIEGIRLSGGGSIVDADILQSGDGTGTTFGGTTSTIGFTVGEELNSFAVDSTANPSINGIGDIRVLGTGGIINASVRGQNIGTTTVGTNGFGVLNSSFLSAGAGTMKGLIAGGLGIRNSTYTGGAFVGDVVATGGGALLDLNKFTTSIRGSENGYYDPSTGIGFNAANDVYRFFQTSSNASTIVGTTNSGIIADTSIVASRSVNSVRAFEFRTFNLQTLRPSDESFPNTINFANSIGTIAAKKDINGLRVVGGSIGTISSGGTVSNFQLQARAVVGTVTVKKNVLGSANFNVTDEGSIGSFGVNGYMNGTIFSQQGIGSLIIDGDVRSARAQGGIYTAGTISLLKIGGDVLDTTYIRAKKSIKSLTVNGDIESGAVIRAAKISKQTIRGSNNGTIQLS